MQFDCPITREQIPISVRRLVSFADDAALFFGPRSSECSLFLNELWYMDYQAYEYASESIATGYLED